MLRIGVIGVGVMGGAHVRYIAGRVVSARVVAICDIDEDRAARAAGAVSAHVVADPYELITADSLDAVVVASPDGTHVDLALAAITANRPALIEKPLAQNPEDAARVVAAEAEGGRRLLSLGFMRRFDPAHSALRDHLQRGTIGEPRLFRSIHRNPAAPPGASARSVVIGSAIHDIDSARWLMGEFTAVRAVAAGGDPGGPPDVIQIQGEHATRGLSSIEVAATAGYGYEVGAEIVGRTGTVSTTGSVDADVRVAGRRMAPIPQIWLERFETAYVRELETWVEATAAGRVFSGASAWDGYRAQLVAEAVIESLASNAAVHIPGGDPPDLYL